MSHKQKLLEIEHLIQVGRFDEAASLVLQILPENEAAARTAANLAMAQARKGKIQEAVSFTERAADLCPRNIELLNCRAALLRGAGRSVEAVSLCRRAIDLAPLDPAAYANAAVSLMAVNDINGAVKMFEKANELRPGDASILNGLGTCLKQLSRTQEAAAAFREAIKIEPNVVAPYIALANLAKHGKDLNEAIVCLQKVCKLLPTNISALVDLATLLVEAGRTKEAEHKLEEAVGIDPNSAAAHSLLGRLNQLQGRFAEAAEHFEKALEVNPGNTAAYGHLPYCKKMTAKDALTIDKTLGFAEDARLQPGRRAQLYFAAGKSMDDLENYEEALKQYDKANRILFEERNKQGERYDREREARAYEQSKMLFAPKSLTGLTRVASSSSTPIFIVGMLRSGTTLVEQILSSHLEVAAGGEMLFWAERTKDIFEHGKLSDCKALQASDDYLRELRKIGPSAGRVTDKLPSNVMCLGLLSVLFPNAKAIICRRDPVDVAMSIYKTPNQSSPLFAHRREDIVHEIRKTYDLEVYWLKTLPHDWVTIIEYESIVKNSEATIRELVSFCGLEWSDQCLRHYENKREVRTPSFWQVRQPLYGDSVGRWHRYEPWLGAFSELIAAQELKYD